MATYTHRFIPATGTDPDISLFHVVERPLYGSSRLGVDAQEVDLGPATPTAPTTAHPGQWRYELTDHLGNVQAVVTEELLGLDATNDQSVDQWAPVLVSAQDYEPGGSLLPGRNYSSDSYRFGFQGQEKDDEMHGATGTSLAFTYRIHDARVGRFLSIDPLAAKYPWNSPYAFAENKVIKFIELEGLETARNHGDYQGQRDTDWGIVSGGAWGASEKTNWRGEINGREFEIFVCPDCTGPSGRKDNPLIYQFGQQHPGTTDVTGSGGSPEDRARTGAELDKPVLGVPKDDSGPEHPPVSERKQDYFRPMRTYPLGTRTPDMLEQVRRGLAANESHTFQLAGLSADEEELARSFFGQHGLADREKSGLPLEQGVRAINGVRIGTVVTE